MYGAMPCTRSVLLARDRIKGFARSVLLARDHNTEWRAVSSSSTHGPVCSTLSIRWYGRFFHLVNRSEPLKGEVEAVG